MQLPELESLASVLMTMANSKPISIIPFCRRRLLGKKETTNAQEKKNISVFIAKGSKVAEPKTFSAIRKKGFIRICDCTDNLMWQVLRKKRIFGNTVVWKPQNFWKVSKKQYSDFFG